MAYAIWFCSILLLNGPAEVTGAEAKKETPQGKASPAAPVAVPAQGLSFPEVQFKAPPAAEKYQDAQRKFEAEDYAGARTVLNSILKETSLPTGRLALQGLVEDTKLGAEIVTARRMVEQKDERKAIARVEKALKTSPPASILRSQAEKFIRETEEVIYLIIDDFEPGDSLQRETAPEQETKDGSKTKDGKEGKETTGSKEPSSSSSSSSRSGSSRWRKGQTFNSDPRFVRHGKGSMKWKVGGGGAYARSTYSINSDGYMSSEMKNSIARWRTLNFWIYLPEADEGSLRVCLAPESESYISIASCLYGEKLIDLRGKKGWLPVQLDLNKSFGNTRNVKLEDIHFVILEYLQLKSRTIYLDFVHFE